MVEIPLTVCSKVLIQLGVGILFHYDFTISFNSNNDSESSQTALSVADHLKSIGTEVEFLKNDDSQDFGTVLGVVLGSAALVAVAKGIADRIRRDRTAKVVILKSNGDRFEVSGISEDVAEEIFSKIK